MPGYGGANYGDRIEIRWSAFAGYVAWGQEGANYLIFHELAHNTPTGIVTRSFTLNQFRDTGLPIEQYSAGNQHFEDQERFTNSIAAAMAASVGVSIEPPNATSWPRFGYMPGYF